MGLTGVMEARSLEWCQGLAGVMGIGWNNGRLGVMLGLTEMKLGLAELMGLVGIMGLAGMMVLAGMRRLWKAEGDRECLYNEECISTGTHR